MGTGCFEERGRNAPGDETLLATSVKIYPPETHSFRSGQGGQKRVTRRGGLKRRLHYTTKSEEGSNQQSSIVEAELLTQTRERLHCLLRPFLTLRFIGQHVPAVDAVVRADLMRRNVPLFQELGEVRTRYVSKV
jgi:hypothetical protein